MVALYIYINDIFYVVYIFTVLYIISYVTHGYYCMVIMWVGWSIKSLYMWCYLFFSREGKKGDTYTLLWYCIRNYILFCVLSDINFSRREKRRYHVRLRSKQINLSQKPGEMSISRLRSNVGNHIFS